ADAEGVLSKWWVRPALAVPFVAQQTRALVTLAGAGGDLSRVAARSVLEADIDAIRPQDGRLDLEAVRRLSGPLGDVFASLDSAQSRLAAVGSPWLLTPVADRYHDL